VRDSVLLHSRSLLTEPLPLIVNLSKAVDDDFNIERLYAYANQLLTIALCAEQWRST
jgi:hypothetical protein